MAQLRQLRKHYPDELVVIGVHSAKFPSEHLTENIRQAVLRSGIEHPVVNDTGFRVWSEYSVRGWPTVVVIDPRGRIAWQTSGEILAEQLIPVMENLIEEYASILDDSPIHQLSESLQEPERLLSYPTKVLLASPETLFIADSDHHRIIQVRLHSGGLSGEIERVFGSGLAGFEDGDGRSSRFDHPHGLSLRGDLSNGTLYVADTGNHAIRAIDLTSGNVRTVAGTGEKAHGTFTLGTPTQTPLRSPWAVLAYEQVLFIAMAGSHQIWLLVDEQRLGIFAGTGAEALVDGPIDEASFNQPSDLALGLGHLFIADAEASAVRAIELSETPHTLTLVGKGLFDFGDQDGPGEQALLQHPTGLAFADNMLYIADTYNHKIKALDPTTGQIQTLIGTGQAGRADGPFGQASLFEPEGVQVLENRLYIADTNNHRIRVADLQIREIHTLTLHGVDRLVFHRPEQQQTRQLEPVRVRTGRVEFVFDVQLPAGYKRNPEASSMLQVLGSDRPPLFTFKPEEDIVLVQEVLSSGGLDLELTLYYCQVEDANLCLIHNQRVTLPVQVGLDGKQKVRVAYPVKI